MSHILEKLGIKGLLFDYGATLDTAGQHWGKVLWHAYERHNIPVSEQQFRDAYVYGERTLGRNPIIKADYTFYRTLETKLRLQMEQLCITGAWNADEKCFKKGMKDVLDDVYEQTKATTRHSLDVLKILSESYPMALVSNFYGNVRTVLGEFGFDKLFSCVIESAEVGIRKPDARIYSMGVDALKMSPADVVVVGDSFYKDVEPAKKIGCKAVWFKGEGWTDVSYNESFPDAIITDLQQLL